MMQSLKLSKQELSLRELHRKSGSSDPYGYWLHQRMLLFRRIYGLQYKPRTPEEQSAFQKWVKKNVS